MTNLEDLIAHMLGPYMGWTRQEGFFTDDDTDHLELVVKAEYRPGVKQTELLLEPVG